MTSTVFWPVLLGVLYLVAGLLTYRRDVGELAPSERFGLVAFGPAFVAAALAAFAGEHFTIPATIATLIPKWIPARLFFAYFVGFAHLAAATSYAARRYVRLSSLALAAMFAAFVLLMDLPGAIARPTVPFGWMLAARQATFSIGALALYATVTSGESPTRSARLASIARIWTALVLICYGIQHLVHPEYAPGVPSPVRTAAWVPLAPTLAYATGLILVACGVLMFVRTRAAAAAAIAGLLMTLLTVLLYVPQFFLAANTVQRVTAINFIFDTLLFAGTMLIVSRATAVVDTPQ
jgi:uncharacterized membrane protein